MKKLWSYWNSNCCSCYLFVHLSRRRGFARSLDLGKLFIQWFFVIYSILVSKFKVIQNSLIDVVDSGRGKLLKLSVQTLFLFH